MARQKNWSYNSYDESEDISIIGNYIWDSNSLSWIKQTAAAAGGGGPVSIADGQDTAEGTTTDVAWVSGSGTVISLLKAIASASGSGGLTDAQLRATPVPVSGTVTATGPLTDAQLRASAVPVSGPLTDAQLRATPVTVSGTVSVTGVATEATLATRLSESDFDTKVGSLTETAPATDTASSGVNGRLQRIAQRLTSLIALLPAALVGGRLDVNIGASGITIPVSGPLTDAQLRASAVPVSGPLTDTQLRATAVPVSGPLTDAQLRATAVPVSGTVTSNQGTASANDWRIDLRRGQTILFAQINAASSGDNTIVAADGTRKIKVLTYVLVADGTVASRWKSGAGTNLSGAMAWVANTGVAPPGGTPAGGHILETAVNEALVLNLSGAIGVRGHMSYFLET